MSGISSIFLRLISVAVSLLTLPWSLFTKFLKEDMCFEFGQEQVNPLTTQSKAMALR